MFIIITLYGCGNKTPPAPLATPTPPAPLIIVPDAENFFHSEVTPVITAVTIPALPIPRLNQYYEKVRAKISKRYGKTVNVFGINTYIQDNPRALFVNGLDTTGAPIIDISLPAVYSVFTATQELEKEGWHQKFQVIICVGFFHELEHLSLGHPNDTTRDDIALEAEAWAETAQNVLAPIAQSSTYRLTATNEVVYIRWSELNNRGGVKKNNDEWIAFIKKLHYH